MGSLSASFVKSQLRLWLVAAVLFSATSAWVFGSGADAEAAGIGLKYSGCVANGEPGCMDPPYPLGLSSLYFSPDGRSLYDSGESVLAQYYRGGRGKLWFESCDTIPVFGPTGVCEAIPRQSISDQWAAVSPDGRHVYQTGFDIALTSFKRNTDGDLAFERCIAAGGYAGCSPKVGEDVTELSDIEVSPNSRDVYVSMYRGIAVYRQPKSGPLRYRGCLGTFGGSCREAGPPNYSIGGGIRITPNGRTLFAISGLGIAIFDRNRLGHIEYRTCVSVWQATPGCRKLPIGLGSAATGLEIGKSGNRAFMTLTDSGAALVTLRISESGHLKFERCLGFNGKRGCDAAPEGRLYRPNYLTITPSGKSLYVKSGDGMTTERYDVGRKGRVRYHGCISSEKDSDCQYVEMGPERGSLTLSAISPDGRHYYFTTDYKWWVFEADD